MHTRLHLITLGSDADSEACKTSIKGAIWVITVVFQTILGIIKHTKPSI